MVCGRGKGNVQAGSCADFGRRVKQRDRICKIMECVAVTPCTVLFRTHIFSFGRKSEPTVAEKWGARKVWGSR